MKSLVHLFCLIIICFTVSCSKKEPLSSVEDIYKTKNETQEVYYQKLALLLGKELTNYKISDINIENLIKLFSNHLEKYEVDGSLSDDAFVLASVEEALEALKDGEFGIGAALVKDGKIILRAHNSQLSNKRSDLHAEMTLINMFENHPELEKHRDLFNIDEDIVLYSSTEPCPMCLTRIAICELASKYGASSDLDGMAHLIKHLPESWKNLAQKNVPSEAIASDELKALAHLMFYSFLFMDFS